MLRLLKASGNSNLWQGFQRPADQIHVARYILLRVCESYGVDVDWHCKPFRWRLEWIWYARQLFILIYARNRWQGVLRKAYG